LPREIQIQDAIMFQLIVVVIEVGWWCWPCDERWYAGGSGKYTEQTRDDGRGNADQRERRRRGRNKE
jgi:hypothetical protein